MSPFISNDVNKIDNTKEKLFLENGNSQTLPQISPK